MPDSIRHIDIDEFREVGFLQEVNRRVLHPCGLALEASAPWSVDDLTELLARHGLHFAAETAVKLHEALAYGRWTLTGVWDYRDDPEGVIFGEVDASKVANVDVEIDRHRPARLTLFGDVIQPALSR